jgi:hypothetical protein
LLWRGRDVFDAPTIRASDGNRRIQVAQAPMDRGTPVSHRKLNDGAHRSDAPYMPLFEKNIRDIRVTCHAVASRLAVALCEGWFAKADPWSSKDFSLFLKRSPFFSFVRG